MLRFDKLLAERVLREEAQKSEADPGDPAWVTHIERLSQLCEDGDARTHLAFFGTALLAKSVTSKADLKWIKPKHAVDAPNAFSARTLAEKVLVPVAADLGIHIGVTSPQPLNNQPYFRMTFLGDDTPIRAGGRPAFDYMLKLIDLLNGMNETQSRNALRAYISVRRQFQPRYADATGEVQVTPASLLAAIVQFVAENSEGGKRAQACVAGLFDTAFGAERIVSGRINDPSRDHPGDVCVIQGSETIKAIEVKDKPVTVNDIQIFSQKVMSMAATDAAYVMVAQHQERLDDAHLVAWAEQFGLGLTLFYDWKDVVSQALYWSDLPIRSAAKFATTRIRERLIAVEVHPTSADRWMGLTMSRAT